MTDLERRAKRVGKIDPYNGAPDKRAAAILEMLLLAREATEAGDLFVAQGCAFEATKRLDAHRFMARVEATRVG